MAREYELTPIVKVVSWMAARFARLGLGDFVVLVTTGRRTGNLREVVVSPISDGGAEYLVSPYGDSSWVLNLRAHPRATMRRGGSETEVSLVEVTGDKPALVKAYYEREPVARRYMDVPGEATVDDFASVAGRFPVFRVEGHE